MKRMKTVLLAAFLGVCLLLTGCAGGQEIEDCLFVISMALDPAPEGCVRVTIKALSGSRDNAASGGADGGEGEKSGVETETEPGYIVMSATAPSCLRAISLLSATMPRTVNLSQLREVVLSRTLAETDAAYAALREILSMFRANGAAVVVVTPDDAGEFIRRQRAVLGVRLSQYLDVLFRHYAQADLIPPFANLAVVVGAMESGVRDAAVVYAAGNDFSAPLTLPKESETDRLPGHLPRTSPAENEYMGAAVFSGTRMTGVLTGEETGMLCLLRGRAGRRSTVIGGAQYRTVFPARIRRRIRNGTICVDVEMTLTLVAGQETMTAEEIAAQAEREAVALMEKLQAAGSDAAGFGHLAVRSFADIPSWQAYDWPLVYANMPVSVRFRVRLN